MRVLLTSVGRRGYLVNYFKQVTGAAGYYQVPNAKRVATLNIGGSATTNACFIVGT
jgi:acetyl-CoA C-acetyltransferase